MEISITQFQEQCTRLLDEVHASKAEVIIIKDGAPWVKLISIGNEPGKPFLGSFTGVGETVGDLLEPLSEQLPQD